MGGGGCGHMGGGALAGAPGPARRVPAPARVVNTAAASALPARAARRLARLRGRVAGATGAARASRPPGRTERGELWGDEELGKDLFTVPIRVCQSAGVKKKIVKHLPCFLEKLSPKMVKKKKEKNQS